MYQLRAVIAVFAIMCSWDFVRADEPWDYPNRYGGHSVARLSPGNQKDIIVIEGQTKDTFAKVLLHYLKHLEVSEDLSLYKDAQENFSSWGKSDHDNSQQVVRNTDTRNDYALINVSRIQGKYQLTIFYRNLKTAEQVFLTVSDLPEGTRYQVLLP